MRASRATAALAATALIGLLPATSTAATDTSPPLLTAPPYAKFVVGSQIGTTEARAQQKVTWTASDPESGLNGVKVYGRRIADGVEQRDLVYSGLGNTVTVTGPTECPPEYPLNYPLSHEIVATNTLGLAASVEVGTIVDPYDENAWWYCGDDAMNSLGRRQSSGWATSYFTGWYGGTTTRTTQKGAWVEYLFSQQAGGHVALVMAKGPDRGKADIYLNGKLVKTVNTYSATKQHRVVVFDQAVTTTRATHYLRIVNKATPGHPRIDVDAVLLNRI